MIRLFTRLFRPRTVIQTRASHKAQREAESTYRDKHAQLARELGMQWRGQA